VTYVMVRVRCLNLPFHTTMVFTNVIDVKTMDIQYHNVIVNQIASAVDKIIYLTRAKKEKTYQLSMLYLAKGGGSFIKL
jgi:hypothetical protein